LKQFTLYATVNHKTENGDCSIWLKNDILVLSQVQIDLANKMFKILEPIEEVTRAVFTVKMVW